MNPDVAGQLAAELEFGCFERCQNENLLQLRSCGCHYEFSLGCIYVIDEIETDELCVEVPVHCCWAVEE
jgi:hypothetical protein